jgi:Leucine-rich repeat (LRR) protein
VNLNIALTNVSGTIPVSYCQLTSLTEFTVSNSSVSGAIPDCFGNLSKLVFLRASNCKLSGTLPASITQLESLELLSLENNQLEGALPTGWNRLDNILDIYLHNNNLIGTLPSDLAFCESIRALNLKSNNFIGSIPESWGKSWQRMDHIDLSYNYLTGTISPDFVTMPALATLNLEYNMLEGTIPNLPSHRLVEDTILNYFIYETRTNTRRSFSYYQSALPNIQELILRNNKFTGTIPEYLSEVYTFITWRILNATENYPYDRTYDYIERNIYALDFSNNQFEGSLPPKLLSRDNCPYLYFINIANNTNMRGSLDGVDSLPDSRTQYPGNYECLSLNLPLVLLFDPSYFNYELCQCSPGYFGVPPGQCVACLFGAECPGNGSAIYW